MPASSPEAASSPSSPTRLRSIAVGALGVLAVIGVLASTIGLWARVTLFDSDKVASAAGATLDDPEVVSALATYLTDQVFLALDVQDRVTEVLPAALEPVRVVIGRQARSLVADQVGKALSTDQFQAVFERLVAVAHTRLMRVLNGDGLGDFVSVQDGVVSVNLVPIAEQALQSLQDLGLLTKVTLPDLSSGDASEQISKLEAALGRELPDDFGQLVVYRTDAVDGGGATLSTAQRALVLFKRSVVLIVGLTVVLLAATVVLARRRLRATMLLALGGVAAMVLVRVAINRISVRLPSLLIDPAGRTAVRITFDQLTTGLTRAIVVLAVLGLLIAVVAYLSGEGESATRAREWGTKNVEAHPTILSIVGYVLALGSLLLFGLSWAGVILAIAFAALAFWNSRRTPSAPSAPSAPSEGLSGAS